MLRFVIAMLPRILPAQDLGAKYQKGYALITGGTDGIGLQIALKLVEQGFDVHIVGLKTEKLNQIQLTENSKISFCDLSDISVTNELCQWIETYQPKLLIHTAGFCYPSYFHKINNPHKYNQAFITSMVDLTAAFLKIRKTNGGIIFFSSQVSFFSNPYASLYAATKAYTEQFARALAIEYPKLDILVLLPGAVKRTAFFDHFPQFWAFKLIQLLGNDVESASSVVFRALGRFSSVDFGFYTYITRIGVGLLDANVIDQTSKFITAPLRPIFDNANNI
ncbi:oxidoreductase, short chain dehydrogenase/reductase family protein [Trichomonas vaginalis G3]|uniref:Oxidoreductase, short chain dehydrogenase/reductase family protein n=1 Tax=Trichomonas vaginalis (strain ATCC PRA-98 / G3) TaxID=412133 RepID=A2EK04_TRIV3|nr:enoyl-(acyl carrier protein) reductase family [Trichomonas vaginalis G3]EAY06988.1 oxidoreductase, short chain dehydrogenase/reductase family protein [Trichomonas vaginalis G3]KAI5488832.1 enoyl-(acyl carrier protein) reductase family [Trichomonas vaginalis G3]|eukprot:XP_001319211.1 oxidoreductase, short chain dehydrogenase/reductase family protein [Trichomonas vaginalis G3]